ncbi:MAG: HPr family phosphocarrier protein [Lachnospiraceae bacterium]|nr:HPr family phosphocarrier protein [Lachnospiraceae bacterium]
MVTKSMTVELKNGAEARPVAFLVQVASQFESSIYIEYDNKRVNAKSIMGMMTVNLSDGKEVNVSADGADETEAIGKIEEYLKQN